MPNRILRDGILTSQQVDQLDAPAELFYRRLMSVVDDYGRYTADRNLLRSYCFPLRTDRVRVADLDRWIAACVKASLVALYKTDDGKEYLVVRKFGQQIRAQKSKFPEPPSFDSGCAQVLAVAHLDEGVVGGADEGVGVGVTAQQKQSPVIAWSVADGWTGIDSSQRARWATAYPGIDLDRQFNRMDSWLRANPGKAPKKSWERFIVNWLSRETPAAGAKPTTKADANGLTECGPVSLERAREALMGGKP